MRLYCMNSHALFTTGRIPTPGSKLHVNQVFHNIFTADVVSDSINRRGGREGRREGNKKGLRRLAWQDTSQFSKE